MQAFHARRMEYLVRDFQIREVAVLSEGERRAR